MSRLEKRIEDTLSSVVEGSGQVAINAIQQADLALWLDKTSVVYEFTDTFSQISTAEDRNHMRETETPAPNSRIWVNSYEGGAWDGRIRHFGGAGVSTAGIETLDGLRRAPRFKMRSDLLVLGRLVGFVAGGDLPAEVLDAAGYDLIEKGFQQVWPLALDSLILPGTQTPLSDEECLKASDTLTALAGISRDQSAGGPATSPTS